MPTRLFHLLTRRCQSSVSTLFSQLLIRSGFYISAVRRGAACLRPGEPSAGRGLAGGGSWPARERARSAATASRDGQTQPGGRPLTPTLTEADKGKRCATDGAPLACHRTPAVLKRVGCYSPSASQENKPSISRDPCTTRSILTACSDVLYKKT
ncbi:hypothetical protein EZJ58_3175 [Sodalis ligni]|uniref:Uncharacterized protein n=1 Tax=Sodalis ligni TaxID=2697027 RepID=A0A4R1NGU5_9GAMM|nr:hypothetical protein EZJ58_3175 [Sodalis ligni]